MKKKEFFFIFIILFLMVIIIFYQRSKGTPSFLVVEVNNKEVMRVDLKSIKTKKIFSVEGTLGRSYFEYHGKRGIRMISSPCPDKLCIKQGWINMPDSSIICLPNRIVLRLER